MILLQFFLLTNLFYMVGFFSIVAITFWVFSFDLSLVSKSAYFFLIGMGLGSLAVINLVLYRVRYFFIYWKYQNNPEFLLNFLYKKFNENSLPKTRDIRLYLQICLITGKLDYINEILDRFSINAENTPLEIVFEGIGFYILEGSIQSAYNWNKSYVGIFQDWQLQWLDDCLKMLCRSEKANSKIFKEWEETFFSKNKKSTESDLFFRILNLYFYKIASDKFSQNSFQATIDLLSQESYQKTFQAIKRKYPIFSLGFSIFWQEAISSLFLKNSLESPLKTSS